MPDAKMIRAARARLGLTQDDVAEKMGMCLSSYCKRETGRVLMTAEECCALADILGLNLEEANEILFDGMLPIGRR